MKSERRRRITGGIFTVAAAVSFLLWLLAALLILHSYWRADTFWISLDDQRFEFSAARGRCYVRISAFVRERANPFAYDKNWSWGSNPNPAQLVQNMQQRVQEFEGKRWEFLGFRSARSTHRRGNTVWLRYAEGPLWPVLPVLALPLAGWLWRRRSWPREQRHRATRTLLLTSAAPVVLVFVLLALLFINFRFLGPGTKPLSGRTSHPAIGLPFDANGVSLKIMTYNMRMAGAYRGGWRFEKPQRVAQRVKEIGAFIQQEQPDIVFLQEVVLESGRGSFNQAPVLAERAGMHIWVFGQCVNDGLPFHRMIEGNAILSRWPLQPLTNQKMAGRRAFYEIGYNNQSTLWCQTEIGGQEVLLASVHLNANNFDEVRLPQAQQLLDFAGDRPTLLAGDFNAEPNEPEIRRILGTGHFAGKLDGPFTISSRHPRAVIDYIFVPRDWQLLDHRVIQTELSDHLPVVATYRVPMSATSYPRQIQENLRAGRAVVTVVVRGEKDDAPPRDPAAETRTGRIVESYNPRSRFVLKPGEGHRDMHKYWRENLQYVLQFRKRDDSKKMTDNSGDTARNSSEAFLTWARRSAIPMPASHEEPLGAKAQAALDRLLVGKRFVFLGEPEHCIVEKYPFRLTLIRYLFARGWRHTAMETGRSMGWRVDRYLESGDASCLDAGIEPPGPQDGARWGETAEFIDKHENPFHEQLRRISESAGQGTRLHYSGYDLDLGMPLGSVEPIRRLLEGHTDRRVQELLNSINTLAGLSVEEQLARIEALQSRAATCADVLPADVLGELRSWLSFLHDSVAAEKRPRMTQDRHGHHVWRGQREHAMMQYLDANVDALACSEKLILMGHNGHLSKDASGLRFRPQLSRFWGWRSWLRALGYEVFSRLTRCPLDIGTQDGSVGSHLHERFPGEVLSIWMLYGQGTLMMPAGPRTVRLHGDTVESLLAQVGDRFLLPLHDIDPPAKAILANANLRTSWGYYASADLTVQADAIYFVRDVNAE